MKARGEEIRTAPFPQADYFPIRVTTEIQPGQEFGTIKAESVVGRALWLFSIKHLLTKTAEVLQQHRWTIMAPPKGALNGLRAMIPLVRLNFHNHSKYYDFGGGWGSKGTRNIHADQSKPPTLYASWITSATTLEHSLALVAGRNNTTLHRRARPSVFIFAWSKPDANMGYKSETENVLAAGPTERRRRTSGNQKWHERTNGREKGKPN